jgi:hypothetical protein
LSNRLKAVPLQHAIADVFDFQLSEQQSGTKLGEPQIPDPNEEQAQLVFSGRASIQQLEQKRGQLIDSISSLESKTKNGVSPIQVEFRLECDDLFDTWYCQVRKSVCAQVLFAKPSGRRLTAGRSRTFSLSPDLMR